MNSNKEGTVFASLTVALILVGAPSQIAEGPDPPVVVDASTPTAVPVPSQKPIPKPQVSFTASRRLLVYNQAHPESIALALTIIDANEELWCPGIRWLWPDGESFNQDEGCEPYETARPEDKARQSWSKRVVPPPGDWVLEVLLEKAGRVIKKFQITIHVKGG